MQYKQLTGCIATALALTILSSCSKDENPPAAPVINIQVSNNATLGNVLTDSAGNTLYFFSIDASGRSGCNGGCTAVWPIFYKEAPTLSKDIDAADIGTITRDDGSKQTTYKGWPLYYYQADAKAGDINGEGVNGVWFVAKPDYTVMLAKAQLKGNDNVNYTSQYLPGNESVVYLTDKSGRTLYAFSPDHFKINKYTKPDFSNNDFWPIFEQSKIESVPSILAKTDFATIDVFGKTQLTYKGWPLYYFGPDNQTRGNTKGVSVPTPGVWPIVNNNSTVAPQ